jgi:hypothetical protein
MQRFILDMFKHLSCEHRFGTMAIDPTDQDHVQYMEPIRDLFHKSSSKANQIMLLMIIYPSLQYNTTVALFIKPNHMYLSSKPYQACWSSSHRLYYSWFCDESKEKNNNRCNDRYTMINPLHLKSVLKPMHSCIERTRDSGRSKA